MLDNKKINNQILNDRIAMKKYHKLYNNHLYSLAVKGQDIAYSNKIIDFALYFCGDNHYTWDYDFTLTRDSKIYLLSFLKDTLYSEIIKKYPNLEL